MTYKTIAVIGALVIILGLFGLFFVGPKSATIVPDNSKEQKSVLIYLYNTDQDKDINGNILCSEKGLVEIERSIPVSDTSIEDTLRLLLSGSINEADTAHGITTEFPLPGFMLKNASLTDGNLLLTFEDPQMKTSGGSCRVGILWHQIEATAKQFQEVKTVLFSPKELFQP